jgi:hypothetical protein
MAGFDLMANGFNLMPSAAKGFSLMPSAKGFSLMPSAKGYNLMANGFDLMAKGHTRRSGKRFNARFANGRGKGTQDNHLRNIGLPPALLQSTPSAHMFGHGRSGGIVAPPFKQHRGPWWMNNNMLDPIDKTVVYANGILDDPNTHLPTGPFRPTQMPQQTYGFFENQFPLGSGIPPLEYYNPEFPSPIGMGAGDNFAPGITDKIGTKGIPFWDKIPETDQQIDSQLGTSRVNPTYDTGSGLNEGGGQFNTTWGTTQTPYDPIYGLPVLPLRNINIRTGYEQTGSGLHQQDVKQMLQGSGVWDWIKSLFQNIKKSGPFEHLTNQLNRDNMRIYKNNLADEGAPPRVPGDIFKTFDKGLASWMTQGSGLEDLTFLDCVGRGLASVPDYVSKYGGLINCTQHFTHPNFIPHMSQHMLKYGKGLNPDELDYIVGLGASDFVKKNLGCGPLDDIMAKYPDSGVGKKIWDTILSTAKIPNPGGDIGSDIKGAVDTFGTFLKNPIGAVESAFQALTAPNPHKTGFFSDDYVLTPSQKAQIASAKRGRGLSLLQSLGSGLNARIVGLGMYGHGPLVKLAINSHINRLGGGITPEHYAKIVDRGAHPDTVTKWRGKDKRQICPVPRGKDLPKTGSGDFHGYPWPKLARMVSTGRGHKLFKYKTAEGGSIGGALVDAVTNTPHDIPPHFFKLLKKILERPDTIAEKVQPNFQIDAAKEKPKQLPQSASALTPTTLGDNYANPLHEKSSVLIGQGFENTGLAKWIKTQSGLGAVDNFLQNPKRYADGLYHKLSHPKHRHHFKSFLGSGYNDLKENNNLYRKFGLGKVVTRLQIMKS